jgi:hypothetical protein
MVLGICASALPGEPGNFHMDGFQSSKWKKTNKIEG